MLYKLNWTCDKIDKNLLLMMIVLNLGCAQDEMTIMYYELEVFAFSRADIAVLALIWNYIDSYDVIVSHSHHFND